MFFLATHFDLTIEILHFNPTTKICIKGVREPNLTTRFVRISQRERVSECAGVGEGFSGGANLAVPGPDWKQVPVRVIPGFPPLLFSFSPGVFRRHRSDLHRQTRKTMVAWQ